MYDQMCQTDYSRELVLPLDVFRIEFQHWTTRGKGERGNPVLQTMVVEEAREVYKKIVRGTRGMLLSLHPWKLLLDVGPSGFEVEDSNT